jgi:hypothetical protein
LRRRSFSFASFFLRLSDIFHPRGRNGVLDGGFRANSYSSSVDIPAARTTASARKATALGEQAWHALEAAGGPRIPGNEMSRPPFAPPDRERISLVRLLAIFFKIGSVGFGGGMAVIAIFLATPIAGLASNLAVPRRQSGD